MIIVDWFGIDWLKYTRLFPFVITYMVVSSLLRRKVKKVLIMKRIWNQYVFMALVILALFASTVAIAYWAPLWGSVVWALAMFTFGYRLFTLELWNPFAEQLEDIVIVRQFINYAASSWIEIMLVVSMLSMIYLHSNEALIKTIVFTAAHFMGRKIWKWEVETKEEWSKVKKLLRNLLKK